MPGFDGLVGKGLEKEITQLRKDLLGDGDADAMRELPKTGLSPKEIVEKLKTAKVRVFFTFLESFTIRKEEVQPPMTAAAAAASLTLNIHHCHYQFL